MVRKKLFKIRSLMTVLIPVNSKNRHTCLISSMEENVTYAYLTLVEGQIDSCEFVDSTKDILEWIDIVVVLNDKEFFWPFKDEGSKIYISPDKKSLDEIIEALLLKKLTLI